MHASGLPEDVLFLVFKQVTLIPAHAQTSWADNLVLLSVCSRWRRVALPLVYSTLTISYGNMGDVLRLIRKGRTSDEPGDGKLVSNAQLILEGGYFGLVRNVHITVRHLVDPTYGLDVVMDECARISSCWPGIRSLTVLLASTDMGDGLEDPGTAKLVEKCTGIVARLVDTFPGITDLQLEGLHSSDTVCSIYGRIAERYAAQARRLLCRRPVINCERDIFARLEMLEFGFDEDQHRLPPQLNVEQLQQLRIYGVPYDYDWRSFGRASEQGTLVFPNLARLAISYDRPWASGQRVDQKAPPATMRGVKLVFPRIETLELRPGSGDYPILGYSAFPSGIRRMSVSCQIGSIRRLSKCDIPGVGTMVLAATGNSSRNVAKDLAAINTLAAKAHKVQSVQLVLLGSITVALPEDIVCPWLTDLAVTAPTGATTVVQLVRQLPNLTNIRLSSVFLDDLRAKSPQHTVVDDCVGPFDSRIEMLSLNFARTEKLGALHVVFAVGLVARLPAAKTLRAIQLPIGPTIARVEELRPQAPRLADIAYLLDAQS